ncbi:MAG: hypothetical protein KDE56_29050 [Anaerolineales bacterium]|nr:hypothetical protein [Anaerolineales bacterium]
MKTAISLPDALFERAEQIAQVMEISRSQLYATALEEYLNKHDAKRITQIYNEVYADEPSEFDPVLMQLQVESLSKEEW